MRLLGSDSLVIAALAVLAAGSVGLKSAAGAPIDGLNARPLQLEDQLVRTLRSQGFSTTVRPYPDRTPAVIAQRGECRLSARDARAGPQYMAVFARDGAGFGTVRYFYGGQAYDSPPAVRMRLGRFETEFRTRLGLSATATIPIALASSPACGRNEFGLADVRVPE